MASMSLDLRTRQTQNLKQMQRLMMSPQMKQALHLMQLPLLELNIAIQEELEQNPVLEYQEEKPEKENNDQGQELDQNPEQELSFSDNDFEVMKRLDEDFQDHFSESGNYYTKRSREEEKLKSFLEQSIPSHETLFEHLMQQARETFAGADERDMAELLIGNFNESGLLATDLEEIALLHGFPKVELLKVLQEIQTFDPPGVGARSLQESLKIQLQRRNRQHTLAYRIVDSHYEDLLHNRIPRIRQALKCSAEEIEAAVNQEIAQLDLHPGSSYAAAVVQHIEPDVAIRDEGEELNVAVLDDTLPTIRLNKRYLKMLNEPSLSKETREYIKNKLMSARWLLKNIEQRNDTIYRVTTEIARRQKDFLLDPEGQLVPLTMKAVAEELGLHESTVARAVANKYAATPRGVISLRSFFTNAYTTAEGEDISSKTVRAVLKEVIEEENKKRPLSDEALSKKLADRGINCARRTVAKYRAEMNIGNAKQRRKY